MKFLILGGTKFLGRALVETARQEGHEVTLFNRGQTNPELFPEVEKLHGDRRQSLAALSQRTWDAVIDTSGYEPAVVRASAEQLANSVDRYVFISTISVYSDFSQVGITEASPLAQLPPDADPNAPVTGETYGPLKALCEQAVETALPGRTLIVRPGLIVGPWDPTDRFTYWVYRMLQEGEVLAPNRPGYPTQFIDVRDLASWILQMTAARQTGIYNATGLRQPVPMGDLLDTAKRISGSNARIIWVNENFLLRNEVQPWADLPLWLPESDPANAGFAKVSIQKALEHGLSFRPLEDTVRDTLTWAKSRPADHIWQAGLSRGQEAELLGKYAEET